MECFVIDTGINPHPPKRGGRPCKESLLDKAEQKIAAIEGVEIVLINTIDGSMILQVSDGALTKLKQLLSKNKMKIRTENVELYSSESEKRGGNGHV